MSDPHVERRLSVPVSERDHLRGNVDARLTLLEYGDYECDYCGKAYPIVRRLREHFGDQLRFAFRNFPHSNIHPHASIAAQAAEAAGAQGKFWEMHDLLFEHQHDLSTGDLTHYALSVGLEPYHFQSDLSSERFGKRVAADYQSGLDSGVRKTPTFFINDIRFEGKPDFDLLLAALQTA